MPKLLNQSFILIGLNTAYLFCYSFLRKDKSGTWHDKTGNVFYLFCSKISNPLITISVAYFLVPSFAI